MFEDRRKQLGALEASLFVASEPISEERLAEILNLSPETVRGLMEDLWDRYNRDDRGVQLLEVAGGYQLRTRPEYAEVVENILAPKSEQLSAAAVETLALIAYRQPITRPEIEQIRGVSTAHLLRRLEKDGLVEVVGLKDAPGRPKMYSTTEHFLEQFGLPSLDSLPPLPSISPSSVEE